MSTSNASGSSDLAHPGFGESSQVKGEALPFILAALIVS